MRRIRRNTVTVKRYLLLVVFGMSWLSSCEETTVTREVKGVWVVYPPGFPFDSLESEQQVIDSSQVPGVLQQ